MRLQETDALAVGLDEAPARQTRLAKRRQERRAVATRLQPYSIGELQKSVGGTPGPPSEPDTQREGHWQIYYERACANIDRGQYHLAIALLTRVVRQSEDHVEAWYRLGFAYGELGRKDRAIECFDRVIRLDPTRAEAWANRGWNRLRKHDTQRAILDLVRAIELDPDSAQGWSLLGLAYTRIRLFDKSVAAYERACLADPDNEASCLSLGLAMAKIGDRQGAIQWFRKACEINPAYSRAWFELLSRTLHRRDWPQKPVFVGSKMSSSQTLPNMGRVLKRENPVTAKREATSQDRVNRIWKLVQNPVTWIVVFILAGLIYTLLGS